MTHYFHSLYTKELINIEQITTKTKHNRAGVRLNSSGFKGRPLGEKHKNIISESEKLMVELLIIGLRERERERHKY
jgi:predicted transcriptional regulator